MQRFPRPFSCTLPPINRRIFLYLCLAFFGFSNSDIKAEYHWPLSLVYSNGYQEGYQAGRSAAEKEIKPVVRIQHDPRMNLITGSSVVMVCLLAFFWVYRSKKSFIVKKFAKLEALTGSVEKKHKNQLQQLEQLESDFTTKSALVASLDSQFTRLETNFKQLEARFKEKEQQLELTIKPTQDKLVDLEKRWALAGQPTQIESAFGKAILGWGNIENGLRKKGVLTGREGQPGQATTRQKIETSNLSDDLKYQIQHLMVSRNVYVHGVGGAKMDANLVVDALHYAQKCDAVLRELG